MVVFKKEGLSKSKIVISEIYSDIFAIYLEITKHTFSIWSLYLHICRIINLYYELGMPDYVM